jgi:hypothetical protein
LQATVTAVIAAPVFALTAGLKRVLGMSRQRSARYSRGA